MQTDNFIADYVSDQLLFSEGSESLRTVLAQKQLMVEVLHEAELDGVVVRRVCVDDLYTPTTQAEHADFMDIQNAITSLELQLRSDDVDEAAHGVVTGRAFLDSSGTVRKWKEYMTTAMALYPLQRPTAPAMLDGTPVDDLARRLFLYGQDAIAIRKRGTIFADLLRRRDGAVKNIISLASGAAVPECDAIAGMSQKPDALFVDIDPVVLTHVDRIAAETNMGANYITAPVDLIRDFVIARDEHPLMPKANFDVVDALGITEYFNAKHVRTFLEAAYGLVRPGGVLIFGNMLDEHPALRFHQQVIEWPGVQPRSQVELMTIAREIATRPEDIKMYIPDDKVYAVLEIEKPNIPITATRTLGKNALVS